MVNHEDRYEIEHLPLPPTLPFSADGDGPRQCSLLEYLRDCGPANPALAAKLLAMHDIGKWLRHWIPVLQVDRRKLIAAHAEARRALEELTSLASSRRLRRARAAADSVEAEHAIDGVEDRRRRLWPKSFPWVVIGLVGLFETWFFGRILTFAADTDTSTLNGQLFAVLAYVPGALLTAALLLAGTLMGEAYARHRRTREGRPTANPRPLWEVALPITGCLVLFVFFLARARADFIAGIAGATSVSDIVPEWSIILLLVMVTVAAILVKTIAHNPEADRAEQVARELEDAGQLYVELRTETSRAMEQLRLAWHQLQDAYLGARDEVYNTAVVRLFAFPPTRLAEAPLARGAHPSGDANLAAPGADELLSWLERSPDPQPSLGPLWHAERSLVAYAPGPFDDERHRLTQDLNAQLAPGGGGSGPEGQADALNQEAP
jgi:hypothetical protein